MISKCLFFVAKVFIQIIEGKLFCLNNVSRSSNSMVKAQKKLILLILHIVRLKFVFLAFSQLYLKFIKPCFNNVESKPSDLKRKLSRGLFPLTVIFFTVLIFHHTIWFNRIFALLGLVYSVLIFRKNDFIPDGLFDPKKLVKDANGKLAYQGERPAKWASQIKMFEVISNHIQVILPKFRYKYNSPTDNAEFMRLGYCQYTGYTRFVFFIL